MNVSQGHSRTDRDRILFVVDVCQVQICIYVVGKRLVSHAGKTVADSRKGGRRGQPERKIDRIEERDSCAYGGDAYRAFSCMP